MTTLTRENGATLAAVWLAFWIGLTAISCEDSTAPPATETQPAQTPYDDAYVSALAAADEFCHAWLTGDEGRGRALLSLRMIRLYPDWQLRDAIVGRPNPRHTGYEISNGRRLGDGRYAFDVRLFYQYSGSHTDRVESPMEQIVVACDEASRWRVDEFPIPQS